MTNLLERLLQEKGYLVADGAMGTNLFDLGLTDGAAPELWNVERPERVFSVHQSFVEAGADIILTNTFGANRFRLGLHGLEGRVAELNRAGAETARNAAERSARKVIVAGAIGPTGDMLEPLGTRTSAQAQEAFQEQAEALKEGGVDVAWIETMFSLDELGAALTGAGRAGLPCVATMSFDTGGRTMMGTTPAQAMCAARAMSPKPIAFGANCGIGPAQLIDSVLGLASVAQAGELIVAKGNCGLPSLGPDMKTRYDGTPRSMAVYACMARAAGARIVGGCCGTRAEHIQAIATALARQPGGPAPTYGEIEASLGTVTRTVDARWRHVGCSCC